MKVKLGEMFKYANNYGKVMDAEENNYIVSIRANGREYRYPKSSFERDIKCGALVEIKNFEVITVNKDILKFAIDTYGFDIQRAVAIEEMSELIKELTKDKRGKGDINHIAEEIADVEIMIEQLKIYYKISEDKINSEKDKKIKRLESRLRAHL